MSRCISVFVALWVLAACTIANGQTIVCDGEACGGSGNSSCGGTRDYVYTVTTDPESGLLDALFIGTHDPDPANYTNICMPQGWTFNVIATPRDDYKGLTAHGSLSAGPNGTCPYSIVFTYVGTSQDPSMDFGFDHAASPNDVAWTLAYPQSVSTDWGALVGMGAGPVHAPGDTCWGYGDVDGDGMPLSVADLSRLVQFVHYGGNTPSPLYECDLNSDGFVDQADIDMLLCFFAGGGLSCFPQYPFPTNCDPDTIRGACCGVEDCAVRSPSNCAYPDVNYLGDNTPCTPDPCFADIYGTKFFDANVNEQRDAGEGGLANWKIVLQGPVNRTTYTDQNGDYSFLDLPPSGTPALPYTVSEGAVSGWMQTYPTVLPSYLLFLDHGDNIAGLDFGNWTCDTAGQICCVKHSDGLIAWWPLDDTTKHIADDIAGKYGGLHTSGLGKLIELEPGKSGKAYRFNWNKRAFVRAFDDPFIAIGTGDYSIDAWIYPEAPTHPNPYIKHGYVDPIIRRPIISNRVSSAGAYFFVQHASPSEPGKIYLGTWSLGGSGAWHSSAPVVVQDAWQHVAVTVSRAQGEPLGTFYYNGAPVGTFTPESGSLHVPVSWNPVGPWHVIDIGHDPVIEFTFQDGSCVLWNDFFDGYLDEVEIYDRVLTEEEIHRLYLEDSLGKCDDYCHVPEALAFYPSETEVEVAFTICNSSNKSATYDWQAPDVTCILGPIGQYTAVDPASGSLLVPVGKCRSVNLTVTVPAAFGVGDIGCYTVWVTDPNSGEEFHCDGSVIGIDEWGAWPYISSGATSFRSTAETALAPIDMYEGDSVEIGFMVHNYTSGESFFDYQISAVSSCDCDTGTIVSLDDLPLGANIEGSINIPPGDSASISTFAHLERFAPFTFQEVVLLADWDDDGSMEPGASIGIHPVIFLDCNANGVHDSADIALGTSPDSTGNGIPDECEWRGEPCPYCVAGLGEAVVSYDSLSNNLTVDNIGSSGDDGVFLDLTEASGCQVGFEDVDLSTAGAGVAFQVASVPSEGEVIARRQLQDSPALCTVGLAESGGMIGITADYSAIGSTEILVQVYSGGSPAGELTVTGGASVATCQDGGSGLPSISAAAVDKTDPLSFAVTFDRAVEFSPGGGPTVPGDELRLLSVNAAGAIDCLVSMAITGELLGFFTITAIDVFSGCCNDIRGNANGDPDDKINISDVTYLLDYLFGIPSGPAPPCPEEGNANGDIDEKTNISDVSYLLAYLFGIPTGPEPKPCP